MEDELAKVEAEFANAIVKNSPEEIRQFVSDDWIIINADGGIIDRQRFLEVIVGISISLLEHGDQCVEIGHVGLPDFKKADRQQRYQKYC